MMVHMQANYHRKPDSQWYHLHMGKALYAGQIHYFHIVFAKLFEPLWSKLRQFGFSMIVPPSATQKLEKH